MKKQHLASALTSAVCLLACAVSAAAASAAQTPDLPAASDTFESGTAVFAGTTEQCGTRDYSVPEVWRPVDVLFPNKCVYQIGEKLDLSGGMVYADPEDWHHGTPLNEVMELIDPSEFDNTKPGTYTIWICNLERERSLGFDVTVVEEGTPIVTTLCDCDEFRGPQGTVNDYGAPITIERMPDKTVYQIGEELDLTGAVFSGGCIGRFQHERLTDHLHLISHTDFDNTTPGTYTIYLKDYFTEGSFEVHVVDGDPSTIVVTDETETETTESTTTSPDSCDCETTGYAIITLYEYDSTCNDDFGLGTGELPLTEEARIEEAHVSMSMAKLPDKLLYLPGQALDVRGAVLSGSGCTMLNRQTIMEFDLSGMKLSENLEMVDASAFNCTKPGTYTINVREAYYGAPETISFEVTVLPEEIGDINCDGTRTISDAILLARMSAEDPAVTVTEEGKQYADINQDGSLTNADLIYIVRMLADTF
ncbi:MAG: dockerin type I repeat-containing protein [Oscillospiraceae bacterium]|nr:dockerin type I repeat-containing protein [Oscillospiraceae bacterium]